MTMMMFSEEISRVYEKLSGGFLFFFFALLLLVKQQLRAEQQRQKRQTWDPQGKPLQLPHTCHIARQEVDGTTTHKKERGTQRHGERHAHTERRRWKLQPNQEEVEARPTTSSMERSRQRSKQGEETTSHKNLSQLQHQRLKEHGGEAN